MDDLVLDSGSETTGPESDYQAETTPRGGGITRRGFLGAGVALATYLALSRTGAGETRAEAEDATGDTVLPGRIDRIELPDTLYVHNSNGPAVVRLSKGADVWRGSAVDLSAFVPGDRVAARGHWQDGVYLASTLVPLYEVIEGKVKRKKKDRLETTSKTVRLEPDTQYLIPEADLVAGNEFTALGWVDSASGELVAAKVGNKSHKG